MCSLTRQERSQVLLVLATDEGNPPAVRIRTAKTASAKIISVRAEWLRQSGRAPSEPSGTPRWRITPRPESIPRIALHITLRSQCLWFFPRLCKSILRCSWKHLQLWICIQDTTRFAYWDSQVLERLRKPRRSVGDFESSSAGDLVAYSPHSSSDGSISRRHVIYHIHPCYSDKIRYLIIWHASFKYLYK